MDEALNTVKSQASGPPIVNNNSTRFEGEEMGFAQPWIEIQDGYRKAAKDKELYTCVSN